ncbi:hypothetical protein SAMN05216323_101122 [Williamwhitmania taraxaci]|uniref:Uncharacterized protein n=1 Tax=Williamwhitmania taraxaci TaxID=1640674 RepID=A0A1G6HHT9_9BACT|nr:hypothetical protein SAMN05216323_101122 [Williamwhitmania taraxaci]
MAAQVIWTAIINDETCFLKTNLTYTLSVQPRHAAP